MVGHPQTEETRKKISEGLKGFKRPPRTEEHRRKLSESLKGRMGYWKGKKRRPLTDKQKQNLREKNLGKKLSLEHRRKISKSNSGENNHFWKGGISKENHRIRSGIDWRLWRGAVFERDEYTCQKCYQRGGKLHPHHIYSFADYPKIRFEVSNGVTLCIECHQEFHKKYGKHKNTPEQLEDWGFSKDKQIEADADIDDSLRWADLNWLWPSELNNGESMNPWGKYKDKNGVKKPMNRRPEIKVIDI